MTSRLRRAGSRRRYVLLLMSGETLDVGIDTGAPVGPYPHEFPFTGKIEKIEVEVGPVLEAMPAEQRDKLVGEGMAHAALASQ